METEMTLQEIGAALEAVGQALYGQGSMLGPTYAQWNQQKDPDMPSARLLVRRYIKGQEKAVRPTTKSWTALLAMVGLQQPSRSLLLRQAGIRQKLPGGLDADVDPHEHPRERFYGEGLPVMRSSVPVMRWCIRTHRYVLVGWREAWIVR